MILVDTSLPASQSKCYTIEENNEKKKEKEKRKDTRKDKRAREESSKKC